MKKEALLILDDSNINDSEIKFIVSRKYCSNPKKISIFNYYDEKEEFQDVLIVDMEKISKEFEYCTLIKSIGERNKIINCIANKEYFSAIFVNGELYLKIED